MTRLRHAERDVSRNTLDHRADLFRLRLKVAIENALPTWSSWLRIAT
jgi:hypothetical protein